MPYSILIQYQQCSINNILSLQVLLRVEESNCVLTQGQFLSRVRGQGEPEYSHRGNEYTGYNQVEEVVQGPPPDLYDEGDVKVGFRTTFVDNFVSLSWHSWSNITGENQFNSWNNITGENQFNFWNNITGENQFNLLLE